MNAPHEQQQQDQQEDVGQILLNSQQQFSRKKSFDKNATIRSNRSNLSTRSSLRNMMIQTSPKQTDSERGNDERKILIPSHRRQNHNHNQLPPPPPYQPSHSPLLDIRRDSSPSAISFDSPRWDHSNRNPRWSTWTADSTLLLSDGNEDVDGATHKGMYMNEENVNPVQRRDEMLQPYDSSGTSESIAGPSSPSISRSSTPPSPTSESALDAALSSTMLALTTANSLLLSTMSSRRELARLRALEAELDKDLTKKEDEIRRQIESNQRTTRWMERACNRLEDIIQGRETLETIEDLNDLDRINAGISSAPINKLIARHDRASSTATAKESPQLPTTFGILGAKDENATIGKSAAKRLERMLQRSSFSTDLGTCSENAVSSPTTTPAPFLQSHSRASSNATSASGPDSIRGEDGIKTNPRPSALRHSSSSKNPLQLRPSMNKLSIPSTATATTSSPSELDEKSLRRLERHTSSSRQSISGRSESEFSNVRENEAKVNGEEGNDSSAARLLSTFANSRPTSRLSMNAVTEEITEPDPTQDNDRKTRSQFLTPPMPTRELEVMEGEPTITSPGLLKRQSIGNIRSPSAVRVAGGHARGTGSSVMDGVQGVAFTDRQVGRKGALEALRRLNSTGATGAEANVEPITATTNASTGWGGTFASYFGLGAGKTNEDVNTNANEGDAEPST